MRLKAVLIFILCLAFAAAIAGCTPASVQQTESGSSEQLSSAQASESDPNSSEGTTSEEESMSVPVSSDSGLLPTVSTSDDSFNQRFSGNALDRAYEEEIETAASVVEMMSLCRKYADLWLTEIDSAYTRLLEKAPEEKKAQYRTEQENWVTEKTAKVEAITGEAETTGGSMASLTAATEIMTYYRARAAVLYSQLSAYDSEITLAFQAQS